MTHQHHCRILVADTDPAENEPLLTLLKGQGAHAEHATTVAEARQRMTDEVFHVLILTESLDESGSRDTIGWLARHSPEVRPTVMLRTASPVSPDTTDGRVVCAAIARNCRTDEVADIVFAVADGVARARCPSCQEETSADTGPAEVPRIPNVP